MIHRRRIALFATVLAGTLLAAGCGGGGSSGGSKASAGDKVAFCNDNLALNNAAGQAKTLADVVKVFRSNVATIDDFGKQAPAAMKADATSLVAAAHQVISSGSTKSFADASTVAAGKRVDTYCGANVNTPTT